MLSQYGHAFLRSLEENRPEEYRLLERSGRLQAEAEEVDRRANEQFQDTLAQLRKANPGPRSSLEQAQHLNGLANQARELVLDEVLVKPKELEEANNPPPDPSPEQLDRESARAHRKAATTS